MCRQVPENSERRYGTQKLEQVLYSEVTHETNMRGIGFEI